MTIESVLITMRSLLDNKPYVHEPGARDDPAFNEYVRYNTWRWLLLDYLDREREPAAKAFLERHLQKYGKAMIAELESARPNLPRGAMLSSPYARGASQRAPEYHRVLSDLKKKLAVLPEPAPEPPAIEESKLKRKLPFEREE